MDQELAREEQNTVSASNLRLLLLVKSQQVYGEYDRLAAESSFRINVSLPIAVLGIIAATEFGWHWAVVGCAAAIALFVQGVIRLVNSRKVLDQAAVAKIFDLPGTPELDAIEERYRGTENFAAGNWSLL